MRFQQAKAYFLTIMMVLSITAFCQKHTIIEGKGIDSINIIGRRESQIKKTLGKNFHYWKGKVIHRCADCEQQPKHPVRIETDKNEMVYINPAMTIRLDEDDNTVDLVTFDSNCYVTTKGITIGSSREDVIKNYGTGDPDDERINYFKLGIVFEIKEGKVYEIEIFEPE